MKKYTFLLFTMFCFVILVSCGKEETIDGKWILSQQRYADGTVVKGDDLSVYECYDVSGDTASYTCIAEPLGEKKFDLQVEQISDHEYNFKITDTLVFTTGKLEGDKMTYTLGEGEEAVVFVFEKK